MKRFFFAVAIAAIASIIVAATASAKVERYNTATFTVTQPAGQVGQWDNVWTHEFTVTVGPDGTFTGIAGEYGQDQYGAKTFDEKVSGKFGVDSVSLTVTRDDGVTWALENAHYGGAVNYATSNPSVTWALEMKVTAPVFEYKNHGDYVSSQGGGKDAAQSPIGMPVNSNSVK